MDNIVFYDMHNAIWRAYVGFKNAEFSEENVIIFNFFRNLRPLVEIFKPNQMFCVWEGHPEFRYNLFADYKANRIKVASRVSSKELFTKVKPKIKEMLSYTALTSARSEKYEADDVIGTLCEQLKNENITVISSDSDFTQLLQRGYKNIQLYNPIKKEYVQAPSYPYTVWKSLNGDKSDNIPSVASKKKALDLVNDPEKLSLFLDNEEKRANFSINLKLIEFANIPDNEIIIENGSNKMDWLKREFKCLEFNSILNAWDRYESTFKCLRF